MTHTSFSLKSDKTLTLFSFLSGYGGAVLCRSNRKCTDRFCHPIYNEDGNDRVVKWSDYDTELLAKESVAVLTIVSAG